jgi:hypothetical protein
MKMHREEAAVALASSFISQYKKYDFRFPNIDNIQKSKWWIHFLRSADLRYLEDWNPDIWVKCQFEKNGKILPFQLYGKKAEEAFNEYKFKYIEGKKDRQLQIITSILATYNMIKEWCKKNNNGIIDYKKYFTENKTKMNRKELSEYFLSICRPYMEEVNDEDLKLKSLVVHHNIKLKNKLIEIMGDDFI